MLYVKLGDEKIPVPREIAAQGSAAIDGFIETQKDRLNLEAEEEVEALSSEDEEE